MKYYFYIIQHVISKKYYAGSKTGKDSYKPLLADHGYKTSSPVIKGIIEKEGIDSFIVRKIKYFNSKKEALIYEYRFLKKIDAANNIKFYNCHNNNGGFGKNSHNEISNSKRKQTIKSIYNVDNLFQNPNIKEKIKNKILDLYNVDNVSKSEVIKNKKKETTLKNYGVEYPRQSNEIIDKTRNTCIQKYGVDNPSKDKSIIEKIKKVKKEKYGQETFSNRPKAINTNLERYGVDNPSKNLNIRDIIRAKSLERTNRPVVIKLRKYKKYFKLNMRNEICHSWFHKDTEFLDQHLSILVKKYGPID